MTKRPCKHTEANIVLAKVLIAEKKQTQTLTKAQKATKRKALVAQKKEKRRTLADAVNATRLTFIASNTGNLLFADAEKDTLAKAEMVCTYILVRKNLYWSLQYDEILKDAKQHSSFFDPRK